VDLRRYLSERIVGAICSLSGMELITARQNENLPKLFSVNNTQSVGETID
jgi:hypothetical protein